MEVNNIPKFYGRVAMLTFHKEMSFPVLPSHSVSTIERDVD
jgi:hypothetical protein